MRACLDVAHPSTVSTSKGSTSNEAEVASAWCLPIYLGQAPWILVEEVKIIDRLRFFMRWDVIGLSYGSRSEFLSTIVCGG